MTFLRTTLHRSRTTARAACALLLTPRTTARAACALLLATSAIVAFAAAKDKDKTKDDWKIIFDGSTLEGWQANEHPESWTVKNGAITGDGPASHLFYMKEKCVNCEFKAEVKINHGGNSGMYFRTAMGPGFPKGYEAQVDNTHTDPVRTGSLYNFVKVFEQLIPDDTWWTQHIIVEGNHIQIFVNDKKTVDFIDEKNTFTSGYLALQQHNAGSVVEYKNLMMRELPPPDSPLSGTWRLQGTDAKQPTEIRILEERGALRWQFAEPGPGGKPQGINFWARNDGYDYVLAGSDKYDHVSVLQIDRNRKHEAMNAVKLRKQKDAQTFMVEFKLGYKTIDRQTFVISPDLKTLSRSTVSSGDGKPAGAPQVYEKLE